MSARLFFTLNISTDLGDGEMSSEAADASMEYVESWLAQNGYDSHRADHHTGDPAAEAWTVVDL